MGVCFGAHVHRLLFESKLLFLPLLVNKNVKTVKGNVKQFNATQNKLEATHLTTDIYSKSKAPGNA